MSVRLYVGNLPKEEVNRDELHAVFADAGESVSTKVIKDRKTGKCRGFAFVTVPTDELADEIIEKYNGHMFQESALKIEKALPRSKSQQQEEGLRYYMRRGAMFRAQTSRYWVAHYGVEFQNQTQLLC